MKSGNRPKDPTRLFEQAASEAATQLRSAGQPVPTHTLAVLASTNAHAVEPTRQSGKIPARLVHLVPNSFLSSRTQTIRQPLAWAALVLIAVGGAGFYLGASGKNLFQLSMLTSDLAFNTDPVITPDGARLIYASDRSGRGDLDIWVQDLAGTSRRRITSDPADDYSPSASPDGTVAFRSDRAAAGIYVTHLNGGPERLLAPDGFDPQFSPDGSKLIFGRRDRNYEPGRLFLTVTAGTSVIPVASDFYAAQHAIWASDSRHLLFWGVHKTDALSDYDDPALRDWWVIAVGEDGRPIGSAIRTGAFAAFAKRGLAVEFPSAWIGDEVFFSTSGRISNLWKLRLSSQMRVEGGLTRLTFGAESDGHPSVTPRGQLVFSSLSMNTNVWELPVDADRGIQVGQMKRITADAATNVFPSLARYTSQLVFSSDRSPNSGIWIRDLETQQETRITSDFSRYDSPKLSPDGSTLVYAAYTKNLWQTEILKIGSHTPFVIRHGGPPRDVSPDGRVALIEFKESNPASIGLIDLQALDVARPILKDPALTLVPDSFSPDGKWITMHSITNNPTGHTDRNIWIVPFNVDLAGNLPGEERWIKATSEPSGTDREAQWSPDGSLLYFLSERDGYRCIWAQRLASASKRPVGAPFVVQHIHGRRLSLLDLGTGAIGLSIAKNRLIFSMNEVTAGNICSARLPDWGLGDLGSF